MISRIANAVSSLEGLSLLLTVIVGVGCLAYVAVIPIRIKNDNCVASPCRAAALSAASRLVLLSNANWN